MLLNDFVRFAESDKTRHFSLLVLRLESPPQNTQNEIHSLMMFFGTREFFVFRVWLNRLSIGQNAVVCSFPKSFCSRKKTKNEKKKWTEPSRNDTTDNRINEQSIVTFVLALKMIYENIFWIEYYVKEH